MLRIIALLCVLLIIGFELTKDTTAGSNQPQASKPIQKSNPAYVAAKYKATHRDAEDVLEKVIDSRKQRTAQKSVDPPAAQPRPYAEGYVYTAKIQDGKVYLWLGNNPDPQCHIGPFVKESDDNYSCAIEGTIYSHSLWKDSGRWLYITGYHQMSPLPVDGSVLEK